MRFIKTIIAQVFLITCIGSSHASTLIQDLSSCDSSFFKKALKTKNLSNIVNDFYENGITEGVYKKEFHLSDGGVEINNFVITYTNFDKFDKSIPNTPTGKYYFWGFESNQTIESVVNNLSPKINLHKISDNMYMYKPEYRNSLKDTWKENESPLDGVAVDEGSAEKVFLIESSSKGNISIFCTIQGELDNDDLRSAGLIK